MVLFGFYSSFKRIGGTPKKRKVVTVTVFQKKKSRNCHRFPSPFSKSTKTGNIWFEVRDPSKPTNSPALCRKLVKMDTCADLSGDKIRSNHGIFLEFDDTHATLMPSDGTKNLEIANRILFGTTADDRYGALAQRDPYRHVMADRSTAPLVVVKLVSEDLYQILPAERDPWRNLNPSTTFAEKTCAKNKPFYTIIAFSTLGRLDATPNPTTRFIQFAYAEPKSFESATSFMAISKRIPALTLVPYAIMHELGHAFSYLADEYLIPGADSALRRTAKSPGWASLSH